MSQELTVPGEGQFKLVRRGYDKPEVDAYVGRLRRQIVELQEQAMTPDVAVRDALNRVGDEVSGILQQAHVTGEEIVEKAEREAAALRESAVRDAAEVTGAAERRVAALDADTDRIWAERERIVADARDLASRLQAVADLATERFPSDAPVHGAGSAPEPSLGFNSPAPGFQGIDA
jgi:DivIVA domain-containing protein